MNSKVNITAKLHCIEKASINDLYTADKTLDAFSKMKKNSKNPRQNIASLRQTADATVLLVESMDACGAAWANTIKAGETVSVCKKECALGYFSFGHEIAHNFGAYHNRETRERNPSYSYGYGHLIATSPGVRSIMAYYDSNHIDRVNYYSNPSVNYPGTNTPTGTPTDNNALLLNNNRLAMQAIADESASCQRVSRGAKEGTIRSPRYPRSYPINYDRTWSVTVSPRMAIEVTIRKFRLEPSSGCSYDYLTIQQANGQILLSKTCGFRKSLSFRTQTNLISITFHSDAAVTAKGFVVTWKEVARARGTPKTGTVTSPNYPNNYPSKKKTSKKISVSRRKRVRLTFDDFNLENSDNCEYDYVQVSKT